MSSHILVPTDGSDSAERAFDHAVEMAEAEDGDLHLLHVVDTERYGEPALSSSELVVTQQEDQGTLLLKRLAILARQREISTTLESCHGDPVETVLDRVDEEGIDTVVMPRGGFDQERARRDAASEILNRTTAEVVLI